MTDQSTDDEEYESSRHLKVKPEDMEDSEEDEQDGDDQETDLIENSMTWKDNLAQKARTAYLARQSNSGNLMKIVYGMFSAVGLIINRKRFYFVTSPNFAIIMLC